MAPNVRAVKAWLQDQTNRYIAIRKMEDGDTDQIRMEISEVGYMPESPSIDGYTDGAALVLHGRGAIRSGNAEVPLPDNRYFIPVTGLTVTKSSDAGMIFQTERAHYALSPLHSDAQ